MFGAIVAGRPVLAPATSISPTQYAFTIPASPPFHHIVIFLLPGTTLPADSAATVWIQLPPSTEFKLLGGIANEKQSAVFKVNNAGNPVGVNGSMGTDNDAMVDEAAAPADVAAGAADIVVGISIEPIANVEAQLATLKQPSTIQSSSGSEIARYQPAAAATAAASPVPTKVLAQRIIGNAFNFLASFGSDVVPLKAFQDWWTKFEKRIELDPAFLEREQG
ncbi:hypothetical protein B0A49_05881 [Cryomyces minteri]|uniref:Uncharacterized protein n=1 Tax=Cryomyces minteri TaxID=331657 RepID=A0A4U0X0V0_9PEZI|nr:hypothetical protein B0A49_05881 [Cryomyces minteri]